MLLVRNNPERALELLLPPFDVAARFLHPLTGGLVRLIDQRRRERERPPTTGSDDLAGGGGGSDARLPRSRRRAGADRGDERKLLQSIVDFGGTLVREVMTPRPDIVAIREDAKIGDLLNAVSRAGVLALPGLPREPRQYRRVRLRQGPDSAHRPVDSRRRADRTTVAAGARSCRKRSGCRSC